MKMYNVMTKVRKTGVIDVIGSYCIYEEAIEMLNTYNQPETDAWIDEDYIDEPEDWDFDENMGFDPYMGCFSWDC